ncbi:helix-turn-helix domain-containing protein [Vibrio sp. JC009]|uniref:helix-turn-helix domain-containing protein n=1 Tax=Vibrio sp. JC009 TaxID=2912314 RepID=UPI0023AF9288|nr:helix-turn-helix transcriptional regulator [Vibrio sp. JC009]WED22903.1 helix-turn-helix domain-containing protein [Vibrio sp. JC009]
MEFNDQDLQALNDIWMSQKAKMRMTQMEVVKKLGISQAEFSGYMKGKMPLTISFVEHLCKLLHVDPKLIVPSLRQAAYETDKVMHLQTRVVIDGEIKSAHIEGNQVIIEYTHVVE